jgi:two-component system response regulator YesN
MFRVLIVDDEEPVLESYEFMLNAFSEGDGGRNPFTLAGKARTGYEALRLIHETAPDLVFMDINIPTIDGLSVLEDVYKKFPGMVIILSTAYERFDLAQRAIPLGVFAYLVKPVSKKTFFSTLEKVLEKLRSLPDENSEYTDDRLALLRRDIWAAMDEQRWLRYRETLSIPSDYGIALLIESNKDMEILGQRIAEKLSFKYHCIFDVMLNRSLFLISGELNAESLRGKIEKLLKEPIKTVDWDFGLGGCYHGKELYHSCSEALSELTSKRQVTDAWSSVSKKIAILRQKIGFVPATETRALFNSIWEPLFLEDFENAKLRMLSFFTLLLDDLYGCWSKTSLKSAANNPLEIPAFMQKTFMPLDPAEIVKLGDLGAWKRWAELNFEKLILKASLERQGNYPLPLVKALAFIRENFAGTIQLGDVASAAGVNAAHLSRLFAEHLKANFVDYLTTLRINEAERLLKESPITVKEAAFASGYQDPNYFSKTFKKVKGILPTEVRMRLG